MNLTPAMQNFILHWGEMGSKWGVNRSVAQIHALLHISPDALTAEEICDTLNLARSNVSNGLKELQSQGLVKSSRQLGDRRDHFTSIRDMFDLVDAVIAARREREFAPTLRALEEVMAEAEEDNTPKVIKARMGETLRVMQMFDDWYMDFSRLPRAVHLAVLKMGSKLVRFLPGGKSD
ncbi:MULTISPECIES: GbsR/MarR family transcriptional regulator [Rhodobacterales]|jgi:DNA-binding transcriptional regulator GbsR (MarR family)|uniref:HTH-type transcriptional regulator n=1 Tax=Phaeobacter gallaeciensis TaxID=60890 RepID=A0A1B0ZU76_9RHOB|nr:MULTISPECIES: MarR family transcriptional regulator [Phaeobacter]MDF1772349.1 MarR family transcriptional regulator [Pseudophaeobacter sp. bin_em_oilr2.035]MEE2634884.1 MarR family transcriptional regulator [Pseudomonadota bacterium]ANP37659.1 ArsR family transcriptional regulator [Phaeobacter gallaeciensis]MDE4096812.1 MarR family transcriptional regulator [Phaeobacter gallaeciensis]MDE4105894.1 MarR family transcriptional regulator [Phaeobacter gallaeciensis]